MQYTTPTSNEKFELSDASYSVSDIKDYFEYIIKKYQNVTDSPQIRIYVNKIENRIPFRIKARHFLEPFTPRAMKLLGSTKSKITSMKMLKNNQKILDLTAKYLKRDIHLQKRDKVIDDMRLI